MNPEETSEVPVKSGCVVRAFIVALPVALAFMIPLSLWIYYQKKHRPEPSTSQLAPILRRNLNAADFERYSSILSREVGDRGLARQDNRDAAAAFIESTMGFDNMGYSIRRQTFDAQGSAAVNLVAELTSQSKENGIVLVVAAYDEPDATAISALMCVAHALAGTQHSRTIRFAAVLEAGGGLPATLQRMSDEGKEVFKLIHIGTPSSGALPNSEVFTLHPIDPTAGPVPRLKELVTLIEHSADQ